MEIDYDPAKDAINRDKHGLSLADAVYLDLAAASVERDDRFAYEEERFRAFGRIEGKGYCLAFMIRGTTLRPISFRRAHEKEMRRHDG